MSLTASLVLYSNSNIVFEKAIQSFLNYDDAEKLIIIDNSPIRLNSSYFINSKVQYFWTGRNLGFGAGHNLAIHLLNKLDGVHIILNPDVYFDPSAVSKIESVFIDFEDIAALSPQIKSPAGEMQECFRLLPTPYSLISRRFLPNSIASNLATNFSIYKNAYNMHDVPMIPGCFIAVRLKLFIAIGGFDESYFLYMEDIDLIRRMAKFGRIVFLQDVFIHHLHGAGSYKNFKLLIFHIISAIKYFNKWGWIFDSERFNVNKKFSTLFKEHSSD